MSDNWGDVLGAFFFRDPNQTPQPSVLFYTGKKKQITFEHQLPKDRKIYFIRISDEIGFLEDVAGSYQSFKYILTVKQN